MAFSRTRPPVVAAAAAAGHPRRRRRRRCSRPDGPRSRVLGQWAAVARGHEVAAVAAAAAAAMKM